MVWRQAQFEAGFDTMNTKTIVPARHIFEIPREITVCPYCNANLHASCDAWTETDDGWIAEDIEVDCENEPDIGDEEWDSFIDSHSDFPYIYWLSVRNTIQRWINANYRFDLE